MKGNFYCICISREKKLPTIDFSLKIFGVRIKKFLPVGWVHSPLIAPSKQLLAKAKSLEATKDWNENVFRNMYEPCFRKEIMASKEAKAELIRMKEVLDAGENVAFACYCGDYTKCHRVIVGEIFQKLGYTVFYD